MLNKLYSKVSEDIYPVDVADVRIPKIGSTMGSAEELAVKFRDLYKVIQPQMFDFLVKQVWLEQHFSYEGVRRNRRSANGFTPDWSWGFFMNYMVGVSQKFALSFTFTTISTYLKDFFPDFLLNDPFDNPELYQLPYKNISLDHMSFVYMMPNRKWLLDHAEKNKMNFALFCNFAHNQAQAYNTFEQTDAERKQVKKMKIHKNMDHTKSDDRFELVSNGYYWKHLRDNLQPKSWSNGMLKFQTRK